MAKNRLGILAYLDTKQFSTDLQNMQRKLTKTGKDMQKIGKSMSTYITAPLSLAGAASIKLASDMEESMNKVDVAFGGSAQTVKDFAKTTLESFGIAEGSALDMAALFGDMGTSMGLTRESAAQMSTSLVGLAGDLASFKNIRIDVAQTALASIFTGETESLKKLGIVMTQANLEQFALSKGMNANIKDMTEAQKTMLRYQYVMEKTSNAHGDFARTGGGAANQMRVFQEGLKELAADFGRVMLPVFTNAVKKLNEVVKWFGSLSDTTKSTLVAIGVFTAGIGPVMVAVGGLIKSVTALKIALIALNTPLTLIVGALALVGGAIYTLNKRKERYAKIAADAARVTNVEAESVRRVNELVGEQTYKVQALLSIAQDETKAKRERIRAIKELNEVNPKYINGITLENVKTQEVTATVNKYVESLKQKAKLQAASAMLTEEYDKQIKNEIQINNLEEDRIAMMNERSKGLSELAQGYNMQGDATESALNMERAAIEKTNQGYLDQIAFLKEKGKRIEENISKLIKAGGVELQDQKVSVSTDMGGGGGIARKFEEITIAGRGYVVTLEQIIQKLDDYMGKSRQVGEVVTNTMEGVYTSMESVGNRIHETMQAIAEGVKTLVVDVIGDAAMSLGQSLATGENAFKGFGDRILSAVADFTGQYGKMLIAAGIASEAFQKALLVNPIVAIAAGAALVAISGAIKGHLSKAGSIGTGGAGGYTPSYSGSQSYQQRNDVVYLQSVTYGSDIHHVTGRQQNLMNRTRRK